MTKTFEQLRQELGVEPVSGKAKGTPTVLVHLNFRLNETEAAALIKAAHKLEISESIYVRKVLIERLARDATR